MLRTSEALPTGPQNREVLSGYIPLYLLFVAVTKIRVVLIANVNAQTLFRVTDRPADREGQSGS